MGDIKKILKISGPYWPRIAGGILLGLIVSGMTALIAWLVKPALDDILADKKYEYLKFIPPAIIVLFVVKGLFSFFQAYLMKSAGLKLIREMRNNLYDQILKLPVSYFNRESSGAVISRILNDVGAINGIFSNVVKTIVTEIPTILFLLAVAVYRRWDLTIMTIVLVPMIAFSTRKFGKSVKRKRKEAQRRISLVTHRVGEAVLGMRIIKVFNQERYMAEQFRRDNHGFYREMMRVVRIKEFTKVIIDSVTGIGVAFALWYGVRLIMMGEISPGDLASILVAIYMVFSPVKKVGDAYTTFQEIKASLDRIDTLMSVPHEQQGEEKIDAFRESLEFKDVSFSYSGNDSPALRNLNIRIKCGEVLAVVGKSGAGKSTLVDLIPRFHSPTSGVLLIDGMDLNRIDARSLRNLIGIVSQDIILFNDTVRENIAFGRQDASDEEIAEAARLAFADEFIKELPEKYDTLIGERGLSLSGGQRQRIAIARAILKNPPILILDEATSSLDSVSEALVQKALEKLMKGRTTIVIAHRLSTIKNADRIIILDEGRVMDSGSHEELIARNETYNRLYNAFAMS